MCCVVLKSEEKFKKTAKNLAVNTFCINTHTHTHTQKSSIISDTITQCRFLNECPGVTTVMLGLFRCVAFF